MVRQARPCGAGPQHFRILRRQRSRSFSLSLFLSLFLPLPLLPPLLSSPSLSPPPRRGHAARLHWPPELSCPGEGHPALLQRLRPPARGRSQKRVSASVRAPLPRAPGRPGPSMSRPLPRGAGARWRPGGSGAGGPRHRPGASACAGGRGMDHGMDRGRRNGPWNGPGAAVCTGDILMTGE